MKVANINLPDDNESLKELVVQSETKISSLERQLRELQEENRIIKEENSTRQTLVQKLQRMIFGPRSEKRPYVDSKQGLLFDEIESTGNEEPKQGKRIKVKGHERRKPIRKNLPDSIPRRKIEVYIAERNLVMNDGSKYKPIGKEITEKLDIIPPQFLVMQYERLKYALTGSDRCDLKGVITAPMPPMLLPKSIAADGLMAFILTGKFCDRLPLFHISKILSRYGVDYPRNTISDELLQIYKLYGDGLIQALETELLNTPLLEIDETTLQVLGEPGRKNTSTSYMFVMLGGNKESRVVLFKYRETRSPEFLNEFLNEFEGKVITDGYPAYDSIMQKLGIAHAGCNQHARRNFYNASKLAKESIAEEALDMYDELFEIEKNAAKDDPSPNEIYQLRQEKSKPIMARLKSWLENLRPKVSPTSELGKAIRYCDNQWQKLILFLEDGQIPFSTILVENAIRPFAIGRKNFLFSGSPRGAHASALFYSLIETAKANSFEPYWYIRFLFSKLPYAKTLGDYIALLPTNLVYSEIEKFKVDIIKTFS